MDIPRFASALSSDPDHRIAEDYCVSTVLTALDGARPDLAVVFLTHHYAEALEGLGRRLRAALGARVLIGCTGGNIIGGGREVEGDAALSLWAATLPETRLQPVHLSAERLADESWRFSGQVEIEDPKRASLLVLGDPFSFPIQPYLELLNRDLPGVPAIGGMASGGQGPGQNLLFLNDQVLPFGAVALALEGEVEARSVVSQGCRPVSRPFVVTGCRDNVILKLRGKGAAKMMLRMLEDLPEHERELFKRGPFIGLAIDATKSEFEASDFLVRNIIGLAVQDDAVEVADNSLRTGMTVQFMIRDSESASAEMHALLSAQGPDWTTGSSSGVGALLFSCGGRGSHMFSAPDHDASCMQGTLGPDLPLAGFFAGGEIGQVGGKNFLHGFTASVALFRQRPEA